MREVLAGFSRCLCSLKRWTRLSELLQSIPKINKCKLSGMYKIFYPFISRPLSRIFLIMRPLLLQIVESETSNKLNLHQRNLIEGDKTLHDSIRNKIPKANTAPRVAIEGLYALLILMISLTLTPLTETLQANEFSPHTLDLQYSRILYSQPPLLMTRQPPLLMIHGPQSTGNFFTSEFTVEFVHECL